MKTIRSGVVAICLALVGLVLGCTREGAIKTLQIGEPFTLRLAESARLPSDDLTVTFKAVTSDSRCPQGVVCVHAGEADVVLALEHRGRRRDATVKVGAGEDNMVEFGPYAIWILRLDPYPVIGQTIADAERMVELRVDLAGD